MLSGKVIVQLVAADISEDQTDAIVSPTNSLLNHSCSNTPIAQALSKAGGPKI